MARREVTIFSISFLDAIFSGFGAVVLLFIIINARASAERLEKAQTLKAEVQKMQEEVLDQKKDLVLARNSLEETEDEWVRTEGLANRIEQELKEKREELARYQNETLAREAHINQLKSDLESMEESYRRLKAASLEQDGGTDVKAFPGEGDRQYLTGVKMGGERIFIMVDASASMLGKRIVDVIIRRNLPDPVKRKSAKWRRAVATVDWLTSQFLPGSRFQIFMFNEEARPLLPERKGEWLDAADPEVLDEVMQELRGVVPEKGTSLHAAFDAARRMDPPPDNLFLLTDGLPTMGSGKPAAQKVSGAARLRHFQQAVKRLPRDVPINVILYPMEGDPVAASAYWRLATARRGAFMSPSEDWP